MKLVFLDPPHTTHMYIIPIKTLRFRGARTRNNADRSAPNPSLEWIYMTTMMSALSCQCVTFLNITFIHTLHVKDSFWLAFPTLKSTPTWLAPPTLCKIFAFCFFIGLLLIHTRDPLLCLIQIQPFDIFVVQPIARPLVIHIIQPTHCVCVSVRAHAHACMCVGMTRLCCFSHYSLALKKNVHVPWD